MRKEELEAKIFALVKEHYELFHKKQKPFTTGDYIPYASRVYDEKEMLNLVDTALEFWLTAGRYVAQFEKDLAKFLGVRHVLAVNSGSSANLLAFMALTSPLLGEKRIQRGDEVITVAAGFPTTVSPIVNFGAVPVFLDVTLPEYNLNVDFLEGALSVKTKAVMLAHTLGNPFDLKKVRDFCKAHDLWLIEDNCDALGSTYSIDGEEKHTGTIGDIGTSSFYPPHHMTMGEGGAVYTHDARLHRILESLRDWGRDCRCPSGKDNSCGHRFDKRYGKLPLGYDHKYVYAHFGYNLKITEMQAAIGIAQLKKIPHFIQKRRENFAFLQEALKPLEKYFILPQATKNSTPSWFGFLLTCKEGVVREKIVTFLEKKGVQTRMLFAGNLLMQPCFDNFQERKAMYKKIGDLEVTNRIMRDTFWLGVYPGLGKEELSYMVDTLVEAVQFL